MSKPTGRPSGNPGKSTRKLYTPENVDRICELIVETGNETLSANAVATSASHFKWKQLYPDYKQRVDEAIAEFNRRKFIEKNGTATIAQEYMVRCLLGQEFEIETVERIIENPNGAITRHTETRRKQVRPYTWWLVRLLGDTNSRDFTIRVGLADPNNPEVIVEPSLVVDEGEDEDEQDTYDDFDS